MNKKCLDHLDFLNSICPDCGEEVDNYGNTESQYDYCSYPDCGCDGARLCMAGEASELALESNVEGMWSGKTIEQRKGVFKLLDHIREEKN